MFRNLFRSRRSLNKPGRPVRRPYQPCLEIFEDRLVPSTTWTGLAANHNWSDAGNWNNGAPGAGDTAIFTTHTGGGSGTAVVDAAFSVVLDIDAHWGGNIQIDSPLTTTGSSQWASGTMTLGAGGWTNSGTLLISGANQETLDGQNVSNTLTNTGTVTWTGGGNIDAGNSATINNNGVWDMQNNQSLFSNFGPASTFNNNGILRKSAGLLTSSVSITFNNSGAIDVQTGTLAVGGGVSTGGTYTVAANALLNLGGNRAVSGTHTGTGAGTVLYASGTLTVLAAGATLDFAPGLFQWTGGTWTKATPDAVLTNNGAILITGPSEKVFDAANFTNAGTVNWDGAGNIDAGNAAAITNSGTWNVLNNQALFSNFGVLPSFTNNGTLSKLASTGTTTISIAFNNNGTVNVASGVLKLGGGGTSSGAFNATTGELRFTGGTQTLTAGATLPGAGVARVDGGTLNVSTASDLTAANMALDSGTLGGTGTLTVSNSLAWTAGTMAGPGTTSIASGATLAISGGTQKVLDGRTLTNNGTVTWSDGGNIDAGNSATINNNGTWDMQNNQSLFTNFGTASTFNNNGFLRKLAGLTISDVHINFNNNNATIDVQTGQLNLFSGTDNGGTINVGTNALLDVTGGGLVNIMGTFTGSGTGTVQFSRGTLRVLAAGAALNFSPALQWTGGTLTREPVDMATLTNNANLLITGAEQKVIDGAIFITNGTTTWTGTGNIDAGNGAQIINNGTWNVQNDQALFSNFGVLPSFTNNGTLSKFASTGTTTISIAFNNAGAVNVNTGILELGNSGTITGTFNTAAAANIVRFTRGTFQFNTGAGFTGNGLTQIQGASVMVTDVVSTGDFGLIRGTLDLTTTGMLNVGGNYDQTTDGSLVIEIGGTTAGAGYGQLNVTGTAYLAGSFTAVLVDDFAPSIGDSYAVITYGSKNGLFNNVFLPGLPPDRRWDTGNEYGPTGFTLTVIAQ
jgi:hypothetical protein